VGRGLHSWSLEETLKHLEAHGSGVAVLLNAGESGVGVIDQFMGTAKPSQSVSRGSMDLRTYGIGAQIVRACGVQKMRLMSNPRRMPSMAGHGLEITGFFPKP
jgi:3,4-dihydroxy 2-butanone 4-phosphate synthase / GTP cyclohydrolase II